MHRESRVCPEFCAGDDYEVSYIVSQLPRTLSPPPPSLYNKNSSLTPMRLCGKPARLRGLAGRWAQQGQPDWTAVCMTADGWGKWLTSAQSLLLYNISHLHRYNSSPPSAWYCRVQRGARHRLVKSLQWQHPAATHQSSPELASLEQAATTLSDSNAVSCTVSVFAGNEAVPFPGNGSPGMQTLTTSLYGIFNIGACGQQS